MLLTCDGSCSNWMSRMLFYMAIFMRCIWSNLHVMLLRGEYSLSSQEGYIWSQIESKGVV